MKRREFITLLGGAAALSPLAWPLVARAQQPTMPVVAPEDSVYVLQAFHKGLEEGGFVDGRNVKVEYRWGRGAYGLLPELATEFVNRRVNVLVATGGDASARAARAATSSIPIVFTIGGDPIEAGLVESINRPGGNATGCIVLSNDMEAKRLDMMRKIVPGVPLFGALINQAPRGHHGARGRGGRVAARGARAAVGNAGDRVSQQWVVA